ncbi:MAG: hypothetical protein LBB58_03995 [Cellulomonadaceae bacterium]|nr:hypothetical protein [Cellulomonadaceae bacterium]
MATARGLGGRALVELRRLPVVRRLGAAAPAAPLPVIEISHGPVIPAAFFRVAAALLPVVMLVLPHFRLGAGTALTVAFALVGLALALVALRRPSPHLAFTAIGIVGLFSLGRPPTLPWALTFAVLGYLTFRFNTLASALPWGAKVEVAALLPAALRDLAVLGATALAGALAVLAQRATGCYYAGASVAEMTDTAAPVLVCHPAGSALTILGGLGLLALALGLGQVLITRLRPR